MKPATIVTLLTQDSLQLNAILYGSPKATTGFVYVHGLSSSAFSHNDILPADATHVSLYLNNRGHDDVTGIKHLLPDTKKGYDWFLSGSAHELFTDCVYDIQAGVEYLKQLGVQRIFIVGHSTGCQKSVYYLSRPGNESLVAGAILICPMSDYAYAVHAEAPDKVAAATKYATKMVEDGKSSMLLPADIWEETVDAQRFLSLYTPDSAEEIFTYSQPDKPPELLQKLITPMLILLAENDEYADRPTAELAQWFAAHSNQSMVTSIKGSLHNLTGKSEEIVDLVNVWVASR